MKHITLCIYQVSQLNQKPLLDTVHWPQRGRTSISAKAWVTQLSNTRAVPPLMWKPFRSFPGAGQRQPLSAFAMLFSQVEFSDAHRCFLLLLTFSDHAGTYFLFDFPSTDPWNSDIQHQWIKVKKKKFLILKWYFCNYIIFVTE